MDSRLEKALFKRKVALKDQKDEFELLQRRRLLKEYRAGYIRDQLKKEIADMEMQINDIYGVHKLTEVENSVTDAENNLARLIVLNDAA